MSNWISSLLGDYAYRFMILFPEELQLVLAVAFFCIPLRRKKWFALRLLAGFLVLDAVLMAGVWLRTVSESLGWRLLFTLIQNASTLPLLLLCFDEEWPLLMKTWCTGVATKHIGGSIVPVLQVILGYDPHKTNQLLPLDPIAYMDLHWLVFFAVHALIYFAVWRLVRRRFSREAMDRAALRNAVILSVAALVLLTVLDSVTNHYRDESLALYVCTRIFVIATALFILAQYAGLEFRSRSRADMAMMEQILSEERKQFVQMKENIDIINMRCHDLKHQLEDFSGRLTDREIAELREAMEIYDSNIRTGSEALDVVLYIHQLTCRKEGIILTCLADGGALSFMRTRHIYALFNNAISNALEAVRKVQDPEKRVIGLTVERGAGTVEVEVTNYYEGELQIQADGAPRTTKADSRHHGFGTLSMRYIAEQYGGSLTVEARRGIYTLHVSLPLPAGESARKS
ncbi:MAG: sensor histidine kinase [Clostridia bacterium]|nr:sensor histidine kinase [Clostridia bacterium]